MILLALMAGTLVSEDLACISAGLLVRDGRISLAPGIAACAAGILIGDVGLWVLGRLSRSAGEKYPVVSRWIHRLPVDRMRRWLEEHGAATMVASRFMPGTRLPLYVSAGLVGMPLPRFTAWSAFAVLLWAPAVVWLAAGAGDVAHGLLPSNGAAAWIARLLLVAGVFALFEAVPRQLARRDLSSARLARWSRWEFWPMWLFYAPVVLWVLLLALRYRGLSTITASNPGMPDGGVIGESKFGILSRLPADCVIPSAFVDAGPPAVRAERIAKLMQARGWSFPLVLKPDVGQRGAGVKLARSHRDVQAYCAAEPAPILVQPYHSGPFEAGVFYYRFPGDARGRVFSITDKRFPIVVGDGQSTLEELIWTHPRYRLQAATFIRRHRDRLDEVLAPGKGLTLTIAGNHAQGTLFKDGMRLWTPTLERRIDDIARSYPGFFVGRFDVRYDDPEAFRDGRGLAIVELNGATAESTDIYDPDRSLADAYRQLFRQWALVFAIGAANRAAGAPVTPMRRLMRLVGEHLTTAPAFEVSD